MHQVIQEQIGLKTPFILMLVLDQTTIPLIHILENYTALQPVCLV
jgi:hypothetical protein